MADRPSDAMANGGTGRPAAATAGGDRAGRALALIRSGDRDSGFRLLFEAYYRPLQRFFARKGLPPAELADLTQETFFGIYRGLRDLRRESRFEPWLYRIATTVYLKRIRSGTAAKRAGVEIPLEEVGVAASAASQEAVQLGEVMAEERRQALRRAVAELPDQMRRCLTLRIYHDYAYREIAALLRIKIDTVKAHLHQGRSRLEQRLGAPSPGSPGGGEGDVR